MAQPITDGFYNFFRLVPMDRYISVRQIGYGSLVAIALFLQNQCYFTGKLNLPEKLCSNIKAKLKWHVHTVILAALFSFRA